MSQIAYTASSLAASIKRSLEHVIQAYPTTFFDSFEFTKTGNNLTHPLILGELARMMRRLPRVHRVGVDVRFNRGSGTKFQPDLVGFDRKCEPLFFVDYESPNSSDARVPKKDIAAYRRWRSNGHPGPYLIVTTLPDIESPNWELRYTASGQCNETFKGQRKAVQANPFRFWRTHWERLVRRDDLVGVAILNIDRKRIRRVRLDGGG